MGKPLRKRQFRRSRRKWEDNIACYCHFGMNTSLLNPREKQKTEKDIHAPQQQCFKCTFLFRTLKIIVNFYLDKSQRYFIAFKSKRFGTTQTRDCHISRYFPGTEGQSNEMAVKACVVGNLATINVQYRMITSLTQGLTVY